MKYSNKINVLLTKKCDLYMYSILREFHIFFLVYLGMYKLYLRICINGRLGRKNIVPTTAHLKAGIICGD